MRKNEFTIKRVFSKERNKEGNTFYKLDNLPEVFDEVKLVLKNEKVI